MGHGLVEGGMAKRSHDALRARDRGRVGLPLTDTAADHGVPRWTPHPSSATLTRWLRRYGATVEAPTPTRPYFTVRQHGRYLAAGRSAHRAIENARSSRFLQALPDRSRL
jgi:hypothetical protein